MPISQIAIEISSSRTTYADQIGGQLRAAIESGQLRPGDRVPSARALAAELGVARGTVTAALDGLIAEGLLETRQGVGTFVSVDAVPATRPRRRTRPRSSIAARALPRPDIDAPRPGAIDLRPCRPSTREFPRTQWRRCLAQAALRRPDSDYGSARGPIELRRAIAAYLRRARGYTIEPDNIVITSGSVHAMHLFAAAHTMAGTTAVVEDPGYALARQTFAMAGAELLACPVDDDGLCVGDLPMEPQGSAVVIVTPSHQFPTGARLSLGRRRYLVEWARRHGAVIIEDDYDGEYRYDVSPLPPLAALADDCVIYCGTFSKTMFPGLRVGFAAGPAEHIAAMARYQALTAYAPGEVVHRALAEFIDAGHFERHVHRMRKHYAKKRRLVTDVLAALDGRAALTGLDSGLNGLLRLGDGRSAQTLCEQAGLHGVVASTLERYRFQSQPTDDAIVIGYAEPTTNELTQGLHVLLSAQGV
ncbi:MAG: PLP-dependent aminotransferase family protein [Pseudomonadota bacterium]